MCIFRRFSNRPNEKKMKTNSNECRRALLDVASLCSLVLFLALLMRTMDDTNWRELGFACCTIAAFFLYKWTWHYLAKGSAT